MTDDPQYSAQVRQLFVATPRAGAPADPSGWVQGEAADPLTATRVRWHLRAAGGTIVEARYEVRGCPHTIAAAALVAERLGGRPTTAPPVDLAGIAAELQCPPEKLGRLFVIEDAFRRAALLLDVPRA